MASIRTDETTNTPERHSEDAGGSRRRSPSRRLLFVLVTIASLSISGGYLAWATQRDAGTLVAGGAAPGSETALPPARGKTGPYVVFQDVARRERGYARIAVARLDDPDRRRTLTSLTCERVYFASGRGLCLVPEQNPFLLSYRAKIFGTDFRVRRAITLPGINSRARVSPDGRYGATTSFVAGHSYAQDDFSTHTTLIDMTRGRVIANLEEFAVTKDGKRIQARDFNFWGVTFADGDDRFYATLATRGKTYLIEGDVRARRARVLHENVECPSLSPDQTRIAYKKRTGDAWRLHVLDLETLADTPLAETRSVDDQVEWLDNGRILYGIAADTWEIAADGSGAPRKFLDDALSPAVVGRA